MSIYVYKVFNEVILETRLGRIDITSDTEEIPLVAYGVKLVSYLVKVLIRIV
jgi:hypothetical protein